MIGALLTLYWGVARRGRPVRTCVAAATRGRRARSSSYRAGAFGGCGHGRPATLRRGLGARGGPGRLPVLAGFDVYAAGPPAMIEAIRATFRRAWAAARAALLRFVRLRARHPRGHADVEELETRPGATGGSRAAQDQLRRSRVRGSGIRRPAVRVTASRSTALDARGLVDRFEQVREQQARLGIRPSRETCLEVAARLAEQLRPQTQARAGQQQIRVLRLRAQPGLGALERQQRIGPARARRRDGSRPCPAFPRSLRAAPSPPSGDRCSPSTPRA